MKDPLGSIESQLSAMHAGDRPFVRTITMRSRRAGKTTAALTKAAAAIQRLTAERDAAVARAEKAEAALRPFAEAWALMDPSKPQFDGADIVGSSAAMEITRGHLRAAAAALGEDKT